MSEKLQEKIEIAGIDFEARQNLSGFFNLLLEIDMRNNPHFYKKKDYENI